MKPAGNRGALACTGWTIMEYEIIKRQEDEYEIWTPNEVGACIGSGQSEREALSNAARNLKVCCAEIELVLSNDKLRHPGACETWTLESENEHGEIRTQSKPEAQAGLYAPCICGTNKSRTTAMAELRKCSSAHHRLKKSSNSRNHVRRVTIQH